MISLEELVETHFNCSLIRTNLICQKVNLMTGIQIDILIGFFKCNWQKVNVVTDIRTDLICILEI